MLQTTIALLVFLAPLAYSPGPGNLFFAALGARFGLRAPLPAKLGYHAATWMVTVGLELGFAALLVAVAVWMSLSGTRRLRLVWLQSDMEHDLRPTTSTAKVMFPSADRSIPCPR